MVLGGLYAALGAAWPFVPIVGDPSPREGLIISILVGGSGIVLFYGAYRLPRSDIHPEFFPDLASWCFRALGAMTSILVLIALVAQLNDPANNFLILPALAAVAGFGAGLHDARAKTRTRELERRNRELQATKAELEETVAQLQTSNERLEQFANAASHDLQEPLRMVSSYLQLLENRYRDELDEDAREFIDFAVDGADRMRAMVESLLEYSRISTHGEPLEPTDADDALEAALDDLQLRIEETDATITSDELPTVTADSDQLRQVFRNLLSNALVYSGDDPPRVHVGVERTDEAWRFWVADEGIGIDPEYHDRIFDVFERLHADERDSGGIGLALCERIVERHGGDIWAESEPENGATFYFTIPVDDDRQSESASRSLIE